MTLEVGNLVTRYKYNHDVVFKILSIKNETAYLKGVNVRLYADAPLEDLKLYQNDIRSDEDEEIILFNDDRGDYFFLPGKVLHIDADKDYLERCLNFYKYFSISCFKFFSYSKIEFLL